MPKKYPKNALANVSLWARLVRVNPDRGYGDGLFEVMAATDREYTLRPYKRPGPDIQIFKAHTTRAPIEETRAYLEKGR
jgi:hypothetical protein